MRLVPRGFAFLHGLVVALIGAAAAVAGYYVRGTVWVFGWRAELFWQVVMMIGAVMVLLGPICYWIGNPIHTRLRKQPPHN